MTDLERASRIVAQVLKKERRKAFKPKWKPANRMLSPAERMHLRRLDGLG